MKFKKGHHHWTIVINVLMIILIVIGIYSGITYYQEYGQYKYSCPYDREMERYTMTARNCPMPEIINANKSIAIDLDEIYGG